MTFVLTPRGERWRAAADRSTFEFVCPDITLRTLSGGMYYEADTRAEAVAGLLTMWTQRMLGPLMNAGGSARPAADYPSTPTPIGGYCAMLGPGSES